MPDLDRLATPLTLPDGSNLPRILPGPMQGVMTPSLCRVMTEFDLIPAWVTPFLRVSTNVPGMRAVESHAAPYAERPVIVQLMGTRPDIIAKTAERVVTLPSVLGIELNCACPSKTVMRRASGSALLTTPEWIPKAIEAVRRATNGRSVGVKVRAGVESPDEIPRIMRAVADAEPDWCVMHYRTAEEFYRPVEDGWHRFDTAKAFIPHIPMFGSGDLFTVDDCLALAQRHPVDGMTPARGLMRDPWLIRGIEARLVGENARQGSVTDLLLRLAELGMDDPRWKPGSLLEIAGMAWGRESERFLALVGPKTPTVMIDAINRLP